MESKRVMEGLTVITVGGILLANTTGALPWSVWWSILSLWPLMIVALGIEVLGKAIGSDLLRASSSLLVIGGLLVGALFLPGADLDRPFWDIGIEVGEMDDFDFVAEHDRDVEEGLAVIEIGAGQLFLTEGDELATSSGATPFGEPTFEVEVDDERAEVTMDGGSGSAAGVGAHMDASLDMDVVWEIELTAGAADVEADLTWLQVERLDVDAGVAHVDITFGSQARRAEAWVSAGVAGVVLRVPSGIGVEVRSEGGIAGIDVDDALDRVDREGDGRLWQTPDFDEAARTLSIDVEAGVAGVDIVVY